MTSNKPKSHHFVPQFILRKFCDKDGNLHSYNKKLLKINKPTRSAKSICSENHLYTLIDGTDEMYDIETFYSEIEGSICDLISEVEKGKLKGTDICAIGQIPEISKIIGVFLHLSFWRLPSALSCAIKAKKNLRKLYDFASTENRELIGRDRKFIRDLERNNGNVALKISQFIVIPALTATLDCLISKEVWFHESDFDLVISDSPIVCAMNDNYQIEGDFYMPISPRLCLTNKPELIKLFNNQVFENAEKIVVGCSQDSLRACTNEC
jgi:hypothetical protein